MEGLTFEKLFNYGVPTAVLLLLGYALYRGIRYVVVNVFAKDDGLLARGVEVGSRYVTRHEEFLEGLAARDEKQQELCERHADVMKEISGPIAASYSEIHQLKQAAISHCQLCRAIIAKRLPDAANEVEPHLREMERLLS